MSTDASNRDVIVVGSGGAGLVAACAAADRGARVLVLEAAAQFGGTTALSGGQMWIPGTRRMQAAGYFDDHGDALRYLRRVTLGGTSDDHLRTFLDNGPRLADYLETNLGLPLVVVARDDYHPDWPGARPGRSLEPLPVPSSGLGDLRDAVRASVTRGPLTASESRDGLDPEVIRKRRAADLRTQGSGLITGLVAACLRRGVELRTSHRAVDLAVGEPGRPGISVTAEVPTGARARFRATGALVLACGGFAHNPSLRRDFLPLTEILALGAPGSTGDAISLGVRAGGHLRGMSEAWWTPATQVPGPDGGLVARNIVRELAYPGSVLVNASGVRFADEASSYNDLGKAFLRFDPATHLFPNAKAWLVFDSRFARRYPIAGVPAGDPVPGWFVSAPDLTVLAHRLGVPPAALGRTVTAMNDYADRGTDPEFGRGGNTHDTFNGDAAHAPNPCLGRIDAPPFHAVPITIGMNGTKGGLATNPIGAVLDQAGDPVPGLFACGEAAAALMGPGYAGNGASLGPSLTAGLTIGESVGARSEAIPLPRP